MYVTDDGMFKFVNEYGAIDYAYFDCFMFKSDEYTLVIVPNNDFETVVYRKNLEGIPIGYSYDIKGNVSVRT